MEKVKAPCPRCKQLNFAMYTTFAEGDNNKGKATFECKRCEHTYYI